MKFLLSPNGRTSRAGYWAFIGIAIGLSLIAILLDMVLGTQKVSQDTGPIEAIVSLLLIWPSIAVSVRRFHDRGMSGWWVLWFALLSCAPMILLVLVAPGGLAGVSTGSLGPTAVAGLAALAVVQLIQFVILAFLPGQRGDNKYGKDPLAKAA